MAAAKVSTGESIIRRRRAGARRWHRRWWLFLAAGITVILSSAVAFKVITAAPTPTEAPEAARVLKAQESMGSLGILIPGYLPKGFDRSGVDVKVDQTGPGGEPAVDMAYRTKDGGAVFLHQWVPVNPALETLNNSRIIETKWGKSWLLTQGEDGLIALWVDVGPLRIGLSSPTQKFISREQIGLAPDTLGLAANSQVSSFVAELPQIKDIAPPPPLRSRRMPRGYRSRT